MAFSPKDVTRKVLYIIAVCVIVGIAGSAVALWFHPPRTFHVVSYDGTGGGGFGPGRRGLGCSMKTWKSSDGIEIQENDIVYSTRDDARADFADQLRIAKTIYERTDNRIVGLFENSSFDGGATIVTLKGENLHFVDARSLDQALTFEKSPLKWEL